MTVPPRALNFDPETGARIDEPVVYGAFVKVRDFAPGSHKIQWSQGPAPVVVLQGLLAQLDAARAQVLAQLEEAT